MGKSTLLNAILGEKLSIVSSKPQTTRQKFLGICNTSKGQLLFLDTPGLHKPHKALNEHMVEEAESSVEDADLIYYVTDPRKPDAADISLAVDQSIASPICFWWRRPSIAQAGVAADITLATQKSAPDPDRTFTVQAFEGTVYDCSCRLGHI